jgi:acyl-CoA synthetase (AMP-forming)/AMP-acid ligase II
MLNDLLGISLTENEYYDTAIIDLDDGKSRFFTYRDLEESSKKIATWLRMNDYRPGSKVLIAAKNSFEYAAVFFGIRLASMIPVLVSYKLPESKLQHIIDENFIDLVFCDKDSASKINVKNKLLLNEINLIKLETIEEKFYVSLDNLAFILYTSGSSGKLKSVLITNQARKWAADQLKSKDEFKRRFILANPLFHMNGISVLEVNLASHELTVLLPFFEVEDFLSMSAKHRAFAWALVTPMISMILAREDLLQLFPRKKIISISLGSSPVSKKLFEKVKKQFFNAVIVIRYGLTEIGASIFREHPEKIPTPEMSVGYPRPDIQYKILDGILWLKSPGMFKSYGNNEHSLDSEGFFNTKDKFEKDDQGFYYFIGRADDMFVCGGENIYPVEIENILDSHRDIEQTIVLGINDDIKGMKPIAFIKLKERSILKEDDIKAYFLKYSTLNKCPRFVYFVQQFPLNGVGKIDKEQLRELIK